MENKAHATVISRNDPVREGYWLGAAEFSKNPELASRLAFQMGEADFRRVLIRLLKP